jgi:hypothetical protein
VCTSVHKVPRASRDAGTIGDRQGLGWFVLPMVLLEPAGDRGEILMMRARVKRGRLRRVLVRYQRFIDKRQVVTDTAIGP